MLRILQVIGGNALSAPATVRLPDRVPTPAHFRGEVLIETANCLACGMCAYVCVSNAITGADQQGAYAWTFEPGQCTFCARCVERCPGEALSMKSEPMPSYTRRGELRVQHIVEFPTCPECGEIVRPAALRLVRLAFDHVSEDTRRLLTLCERCKRKDLQRKMFAGAQEVATEAQR